MEDNTVIFDEQIANEIEANDLSSVPAEKCEEYTADRQDNTTARGNTAITKKFLAAALAVTILINAGFTAGLMLLFDKNDSAAASENPVTSSETFPGGGPGGNGQMAPPQNNGQMAPPQNNSSNS